MEESTMTQNQAVPQRFYALEQLTDRAQTIRLIADALQVYRGQVAQQLDAGEQAQAYDIYQVLERQRDTLVELLRSTRPFLMELEHPLAVSVDSLAGQLSAFRLMTKDYSKLTAVLKQFANSLPNNQTTNTAVIGRLMNNVRMGYYPTASPAVIMRNIFENPAWYTSYTPYQAEISQGRLEALLNFQTMVISLTGMEISNCSLLDEGTAAAEAMTMMLSLRSRDAVKEGRNQLFVDNNIFPQTLDVLLTRSEPFGIELVMGDAADYEFTGNEFGAIVQYPGADGAIVDYSGFAVKAHERGIWLRLWPTFSASPCCVLPESGGPT